MTEYEALKAALDAERQKKADDQTAQEAREEAILRELSPLATKMIAVLMVLKDRHLRYFCVAEFGELLMRIAKDAGKFTIYKHSSRTLDDHFGLKRDVAKMKITKGVWFRMPTKLPVIRDGVVVEKASYEAEKEELQLLDEEVQ